MLSDEAKFVSLTTGLTDTFFFDWKTKAQASGKLSVRARMRKAGLVRVLNVKQEESKHMEHILR